MADIIHILSEETINQIAAGEVIENPASVIKELVENAVDAQATRITIEVQGGGFQSILVRDDGIGMSAKDALACLERHATSKIRRSEDLALLHTMGFRGEALASIAAISKLTLSTAQKERLGTTVDVEGGKVIQVEPSARPEGTTIEVRSLFYNVPARKKFQKTAAASSAEITRLATLLALAHPHVGFELVQQKRTVFLVAPCKNDALQTLLQRRSTELLGEHFKPPMRYVHCKEQDYEIHGLIGDPLLTRYNRSGQYLFINNRPIHCPALSFAIRDGYATRLDIDRHPIFVIHAAIAPSLIDVNVHPQKKEVRLREESVVKQIMRKAVSQALQRQEAEEIPAIDLSSERIFATFPAMGISRETNDFVFQETDRCNPLEESRIGSPDFFSDTIIGGKAGDASLQTQCNWELDIKTVGIFEHFLIVDAKSLQHTFINPYALGSEQNNGVVWVDLLAAQARVLYESLLKGVKNENAIQRLLLPVTFSCSRAEAEQLLCCMETLQQLGVHMRSIGPTVFMIEAIPACMEERDVHDILQAILSSSAETDVNSSVSDRYLRECASRICQTARSCKRTFCLEEALGVFKELMDTQDPYHCPQGKSTLRYIRKEEIESYFNEYSKK